ncbi:hypothetical protein MHM84_00450 [Halomonas sp. McH1-25]|uniref:hypothetical protein n=1 Tax=unclassified Halomonas TaxID=2609666 RepID=UPI001EF60F4B|nr:MULTISPECIES: hypothetical protein [unclassified Halomonas]MCG7598251.1 hypothetical protein [Halomonas sp. McH1-25]MCP1340966.1 hypothetical protein [Halomonas sp. FL8]MCP1361450.1 hypothetical protein [Halomonas sp. BBD45]MCP1363951.1 hypothetical protein [Halomonas sp. BBD48]
MSAPNIAAASPPDLIYEFNSQQRAIAKEYDPDDGEERMKDRFVKGWAKVMENDRFDLHR